MTRGVLYITWGRDFDSALNRSIASLKHWHPELPYHVAEMPAGSNLLCKSRMYDLSPFDETLFLDADTTILGKLDYGFLQARRYGVALCISANPWQRRYDRIESDHPDAVEYSSGVVFFSKAHPLTASLFARWNVDNAYDSSTAYLSDDGVKRQQYNDQALLTLAIHRARLCPFVLPLNWNLSPKWQRSFFGEVKIWHGYDDIQQSLLKWNEEQSQPGAVIGFASLP